MQRQLNRPIFPMKLVYLVIATLCVFIGILGLIVPVIPGILFLIVAVYFLGKVSTRIRNWSNKQPVLKSLHQKLHRLGRVDFVDRIKVISLMSIEMICRSVDQVNKSVRQVRRSLS